jgi:hypothetical protein
MDAELSTLAATAATTLVGLLTTDAWERVKGGLGALWRRAYPERAATIEAEIAESRSELLALDAGDDDQLIDILVREWESRLYRLLITNPDLDGQLRQLLDGGPARPPATDIRIERLEMRAEASGQARVYQVGQGQQQNG